MTPRELNRLRRERRYSDGDCVACGTAELTDGARGCSVHRYSVGPFFDGGESK